MSEQITTMSPQDTKASSAPRVPLGQRLLKWREPATWVAVMLTFGFLAAGLIQILLNLFNHHMGLGRATRALSSSVAIGWLVFVLLLVGACAYIRPETGHVKLLSKIAAISTWLVVAYDLFLLATDLSGGGTVSSIVLEVIGALIALGVKAGIAAILWRISATLKAPERPARRSANEELPTVWRAEEAVSNQWAKPADELGLGNVHDGGSALSESQRSRPADWRSGVAGLSTAFAAARPTPPEPETSRPESPATNQHPTNQPVSSVQHSQARLEAHEESEAGPSLSAGDAASARTADDAARSVGTAGDVVSPGAQTLNTGTSGDGPSDAGSPDAGSPDAGGPDAGASGAGSLSTTPSLIRIDAMTPRDVSQTGPVVFNPQEHADGATVAGDQESGHGADDPGKRAQGDTESDADSDTGREN